MLARRGPSSLDTRGQLLRIQQADFWEAHETSQSHPISRRDSPWNRKTVPIQIHGFKFTNLFTSESGVLLYVLTIIKMLERV